MKKHPGGTSEGRTRLHRLLAFCLAAALLLAWLLPDAADAKRRRRRPAEPPLRILSVTFSPEHYVAGEGSLDIIVDVGLPADADGAIVLELSSLITSPSKRHVRFLWSRKPIDLHFHDQISADGPRADPVAEDAGPARRNHHQGTPDEADGARVNDEPEEQHRPDHVSVTLRWDGTDQNEELVPGGRYDYVIRAKLLTREGEKLQTHMVSWKQKGSVRIKPPDPLPADVPELPEAAAEPVEAAAQANEPEPVEPPASQP